MPILSGFNAGLKLTVSRDPIGVIAGVSVRVINSAGLDVTTILFGQSNPKTDSDGVLIKYLPLIPLPVPAGVYTFQLTKPGWIPRTFTSNPNGSFVGFGEFNVSMLKSYFTTDEYIVTKPELYVSALVPIIFYVNSPASGEVERISTNVKQLTTGVESDIHTPVPSDNLAYVDIRNRIRLKPIPGVVGESDKTAEDIYFSEVVNVNIKVSNEDGDLVIPLVPGATDEENGQIVYAANMWPDVFATSFPVSFPNFLSNYVANRDEPAKWISLKQEPICFVGYYFDTMVWLPDPNAAYVIKETYCDYADAILLVEETSIEYSLKVQRVRVNNNPPLGSAYVLVEVFDTIIPEMPVTQVLKVVYQYGNTKVF